MSIARTLSLLLAGVFPMTAFAVPADHKKWMVGTWTTHNPQRPDRVILFHANHTWGVRGYVPLREEIDGRRWHIVGDKLILRYRGDHGFETTEDQILSFAHDKVVTDAFTYTRTK